MRVAEVVNSVIYHVYEMDAIPIWPPYLDGTIPVLVDISGTDLKEGSYYRVRPSIPNKVTSPVTPKPVHSSVPFPLRDNIMQNIQTYKTGQLQILNSESYQQKALLDSDFAERIRLSIGEWENLEKQAGYPDNIDWPEFWEALPE